MHTYLRAIGYSKPISREKIFSIIDENIGSPASTAYAIFPDNPSEIYGQFDISLGNRIGLSVFGTFNDKDQFYSEYYYPYLTPAGITSVEVPEVEKRVDTEAMSVICDDLHLGVTVVYRLLNCLDYEHRLIHDRDLAAKSTNSMSALSVNGEVILPIEKSVQEIEYGKQLSREKMDLMAKARDGDDEAGRKLDKLDWDTSDSASLRMERLDEDVYSVVDSLFMPTSVECEVYNVMGDIVRVQATANRDTLEEIWILTIDVNGLKFDVGINKKDLRGEPVVGRRFHGKIWMMGKLIFPDPAPGQKKDS